MLNQRNASLRQVEAWDVDLITPAQDQHLVGFVHLNVDDMCGHVDQRDDSQARSTDLYFASLPATSSGRATPVHFPADSCAWLTLCHIHYAKHRRLQKINILTQRARNSAADYLPCRLLAYPLPTYATYAIIYRFRSWGHHSRAIMLKHELGSWNTHSWQPK